MTIAIWDGEDGAAPRRIGGRHRTWLRRALLLAALLAGAGWAADVTGPVESSAAVARAGADLARLLRFMAAVKGAMALGAAALLWWRLALPATAARLIAVAVAAGAMAAGPVLIWGMAHVALGAVLLHGGLAGALAALWGDPAIVAWLGERAAVRRGGQRGGTGKARTSPV